MPRIEVYVTPEEEAVIRTYAAADTRRVSNLMKHAVAAQVKRSKKKDQNGAVIKWPTDEAI